MVLAVVVIVPVVLADDVAAGLVDGGRDARGMALLLLLLLRGLGLAVLAWRVVRVNC